MYLWGVYLHVLGSPVTMVLRNATGHAPMDKANVVSGGVWGVYLWGVYLHVLGSPVTMVLRNATGHAPMDKANVVSGGVWGVYLWGADLLRCCIERTVPADLEKEMTIV